MYHSKSLSDDSFKNHADRVWRIVKYENYNNKANTYKLNEGDTIKFGRVRFKVKMLVVDSKDCNSGSFDDNEHQSNPTKTNNNLEGS